MCPGLLGLGRWPGPRRRQSIVRQEAAVWAQAWVQGLRARGMPNAQGHASSTDADAVALTHDDKGAPHIAADPGAFPDFRICGFFEKCGLLHLSNRI